MGQGESNLRQDATDQQNDQDSNVPIQVTINNVMHKVSSDIPVDMSLNTFIREVLNLKGTKAMCLEGGCGACIVAAEMNGHVMSVNSCLVPVYICDGWKISTIEGIGSRKKGYHTLQAALADMNGSQCGFCSPGWVMSMFSLVQSKQMTMKEIENSFASNLCRCTGYRPILDTFKSFASDAPPMMQAKIKDIEELYNIKSCKACPKKICNGTCSDLEIIYKSSIPRYITLNDEGSDAKFYKLLKIDDVFQVFQRYSNETYIIHGGNTAHGVYRTTKKQIYIDVNSIPDLHRIEKNKDFLIFGGNVSLSTVKAAFEKYACEPGFAHLSTMAKHVDLVATIPVRNIGSIAGNLMTKHDHPEFPSDIFLILETAGAEIHILDSPDSKSSMSLFQFLTVNMDRKLIYSIVIPALSKEYNYNTYKIMPRAQNAHAIVNAGFLFKLSDDGTILERPNVIFGGIRPDFLHAEKTEDFFEGKSLFDVNTVKKGLSILNSEIKPDHVLPDFKPQFRKLLAVSLLYKNMLRINADKVKPRLRSGATMLKREVSSGKRDYDTDRNLWPLNEPMTKIGAIYQTSGEGEYIDDIITNDNEVFCVLTIADRPGAIEKIQYEEAMDMDGVIAFYSAKDVPGRNVFVNKDDKWPDFWTLDEALFADKEITYAGQPYGMIVAKNRAIAQLAASTVKLVYPDGPKQKPMITVHDVIASNDKKRIKKVAELPAKKSGGKDSKHKIKGNYECGPQYHFHMETQTCVCVPIEDGMDVFSSTQYIDLTLASIAAVLGVQNNSINIKVRRLGGAYGAKISRSVQIACACALACHKLDRPARMVMTIEDNMRSMGKRVPAYFEYDLTVDDDGKIQSLDMNYWGNLGGSFNESMAIFALSAFYNCYEHSAWSLKGYDVKTDVPANTWCRAPGTNEGIAAIEFVMERIAKVTGKDPLDVKMANLDPTDKDALTPMISSLKITAEYDKRKTEIDQFNKDNRWKKRGIALVPMKFGINPMGGYRTLVAIHARDGTVSVTIGGIEMGQGLFTKMAQIVAYSFKIDINMVMIKPNNTLTSANDSYTGSSFGSDVCGYATLAACRELLNRLKPVREKLGGNPTWRTLCREAYKSNVDLCASRTFTKEQNEVKKYSVYGVAISEVELDLLTGQHLVSRVDIMEDTGISLSPKIDVGQVEGAFVMGIGFWTCEDLIYDPQTAGLTNYRTWNYKIPGAKDIPVDFRISFRRNAPNPNGIVRSKAIGEPPFCLSCSIPIAIRYALNSARADAGNKDPWYELDNALTIEKILLKSLTDVDGMGL